MKAIRFVFCLFAALMLTTLNGLAAEDPSAVWRVHHR